MRVIRNKAVLIMTFAWRCLFAAPGCGLAEPSFIWQQMPLRTKAMADAGLFGGDGFQQIYGFSYAPSDPKRVYCAIDCARVWRSDDGGNSWFQSSRGLLANGGMDLAVDPADANIVFLAGSQGLFVSETTDGVYRTLNGGVSWERIFPALFRKFPIQRGGTLFWIDPESRESGRHRKIYVAVQDKRGIFRTDDGGDTWVNIGVEGLGLIYDFQRNPFKPEFWVSTENGLFILAQNAGRWVSRKPSATAGLPLGSDNAVSRIQFNTVNSNIIYAICGKAGFYKSTDGGKSFFPAQKGIPSGISGNHFAAMLDMNPVNPDWLILGHHNTGFGNFQSFNGGETWLPFQNMDRTGMVKDLLENPANSNVVNSFWVGHKAAFHPYDPLIALIPGHFWQMEKTVDGGKSWEFSGNGFCGVRVGIGRTSFGFPGLRKDEINLFCTDCGAFRSTDNGKTFSSLHSARTGGAMTASVGAVHPQDSNTVLCASGTWNSQKLIMTYDGGSSWKVVLDTPSDFRFCMFHPQRPDTIYAGTFRSDDGGNTWIRLNRAIADVYPENGNTVYSFTSAAGTTKVYRSDDCGNTWVQTGSDISAGGTQEIAVDPRNPVRLLIPAGNGLNIWDGVQWIVAGESSGLLKDWYGGYNFRNIAVHPAFPEMIFIARLASRTGYTRGVFCSWNGGKDWKDISGNLGPEMAVWAMNVDPRSDRLYIGTSQGTWYLGNVSAVMTEGCSLKRTKGGK